MLKNNQITPDEEIKGDFGSAPNFEKFTEKVLELISIDFQVPVEILKMKFTIDPLIKERNKKIKLYLEEKRKWREKISNEFHQKIYNEFLKSRLKEL